ncbi:class I SAM-dependent methyltransferase [Phormidesmis sp. 146-33]
MHMVLSNKTVHSSYLVDRLLSGKDENLFNSVKFRLIAQALRKSNLKQLRILDLGCADKVAFRYLSNLGVDFDYCGVDYESPFSPDILSDIRDSNQIISKLPWQPNVIFLLDVLEHLEGLEVDILQVLQACCSILPPGGLVVVTIPQMYRLDRFKFKHLHYKEHKIRLRQDEWYNLLSHELKVCNSQGVGFISVLPYLVMFHPRYEKTPFLMRLFKQLREKTLEKPFLRKLDWHLSRLLGGVPFFRKWTNDVLFVCEVPRAKF